MDLRVAAMGHHKLIVEAPEDGKVIDQHTLVEHAKHLLGKTMLGNTIEMIKTCLGRPTDIERRGDMRAGPIENAHDLLPILHILKVQQLDGAPVTIMPSHFCRFKMSKSL